MKLENKGGKKMNNFSDLTCTRLSQALGKPKRERERNANSCYFDFTTPTTPSLPCLCTLFIVCFRNSLLLVVVRCWARVEVGLG